MVIIANNLFCVSSVSHGCPCGYNSDPKRKCKCSPNQVERYMSRISGPLIDRIDIHIDVPTVPYSALSSKKDGTNSAMMRESVLLARNSQKKRFADVDINANANMSSPQIRKFCPLNDQCQMLLKQAVYGLGLSARAHDKVLRLARTITDIEKSSDIESQRLAEAITYRKLDRSL